MSQIWYKAEISIISSEVLPEHCANMEQASDLWLQVDSCLASCQLNM